MSENVLGPQFYHGSPNYLKIGDVVEPTIKWPLGDNIVYAYATTDKAVAKRYARQSPESQTGVHRLGQGTLFGTIYNVEPVDPEEVAGQRAEGSEKAVVSTKGFRVTGVDSHVARSFPKYQSEDDE